MRRRRPPVEKKQPKAKRPIWLSVLVVAAITVMLFVSINFRSYTAKNDELRENEQLSQKIESLTDENLQLQDEIHSLKTDPNVIQREAKRLGIRVGQIATAKAAATATTNAKSQVPVPAKR